MKFAKIIIDISHSAVDRTFEYIIPKDLESLLREGQRVLIPFGAGNSLRRGYVMDISDSSQWPVEKLKEIIKIDSDAEDISEQLVELAGWMKHNYGGTMNQALMTVMPVKKKESAKMQKVVSLNKPLEEIRIEYTQLLSRKRHAIGKEVLLKELMEVNSLQWQVITEKLLVASHHIRDLQKQGLVKVEEHRIYRNPSSGQRRQENTLKLNEEQQGALDIFTEDYSRGERNTYLLYGVTGAGKTQVYIEILNQVLKSGKEAIVLIPEIALTYQTLKRFYGYFGDKVSVINSKMSPAERADQFERAKNGDISVMIGPRSALFTPFTNLGLIIIDEEHEASYKSEVVPKYHARECAIERARLCQAAVVLGSATPSVETYYKAINGEIKLLTLKNRATGASLPDVKVVDLRQELKNGNRSILSKELQGAIADRLQKQQQVMLYLNRRGLMGFVSCRSCGEVIKCPHCDVSLSLHQDNNLRCHYCGYSVPAPKACPSCGSPYIGGFKAGTQKLCEEVEKLFPEARVLRMDTDTTKEKDGYEKILSAFAAREADILVGTQMIVKGHDFPGVTLVGVVAADISLNDSNYLSAERTFQLLTQAVGRAGRGDTPGEAIIQTYNPENFAITCSAAQDYEGFFAQESAFRKLMKYPPAAHILLITITSKSYESAKAMSEAIRKGFESVEKARPIRVLGPTDASIAKIDDVYRRLIYIKYPGYELLVALKDMTEKFCQQQKTYKNTNVFFDFDPLSGF